MRRYLDPKKHTLNSPCQKVLECLGPTTLFGSALYYPGLAYVYLTTMGRRQAVRQLLEDVENLRGSQAIFVSDVSLQGGFPCKKSIWNHT